MKKISEHNENNDQQQQEQNTPSVDRREFMAGSVSLGAAVLGAGALAGAGMRTAQAADMGTIDWKTIEPGDRANDLYAPQEGFNDADVTWWHCS